MRHAAMVTSAALFLLAVGLRAPVLLHPDPITIDEARYLVAAHHLRSGVGYSDWRGPEIDIHPLHPALVAFMGGSIGSLEARGRGVAFGCAILMLWPLATLAGRLGGRKAWVLCLLLTASNPWLIRTSACAQPESVYVLFTAVAILALWPGMAAEISTWRWTLAGALYGLAYLARPEGLPVGFFAGGIVLLSSVGVRRQKLIRFGAFAAALLICASPYLVFLRSATGEWTVTGKTAEVFFVGQSLYDSGGIPPDAATYLGLMKRWGGVMPFIAANPGIVVLRAAMNAVQIGVRALPLALGPAGLAGILACGAIFLRQPEQRCGLALSVTPALTLLLMLLTYRNDRVIASVVPFLLAASAAGLVAAAERLDLLRGRRLAWTCTGLTAALLCCWLPLAARAAGSQLPDRSLDRRAVDAALDLAGSATFLVSNNPALSFYAGDPSLFGPPGRYAPLLWSQSCRILAEDLHRRGGGRIALLDGDLWRRISDLESIDCPLREAAAFEDRAADRRISILAWK